MIYWFTGQPAHGKTTLSQFLYHHLCYKYGIENVFVIDGDDIRKLFENTDYTIRGRMTNVTTAQKIAEYLNNKDKHVIVAIVSPYIEQREEFKKKIGNTIIEIYVHTNEIRGREKYAVQYYQKPEENYIDLDTTKELPYDTYMRLIAKITEREQRDEHNKK